MTLSSSVHYKINQMIVNQLYESQLAIKRNPLTTAGVLALNPRLFNLFETKIRRDQMKIFPLFLQDLSFFVFKDTP